MSIDELKKESIEYLKKNNVFEYDMLDIYKLVMYYLNIEDIRKLINNTSIELRAEDLINILKLIHNFYVLKIPLQYITGKQYFFREQYIVNENVLIPRSDTEILVEKAIEYITKYSLLSMLDMCTGSGCVGISTAKNSSIKNVILADISNKALDVANQNIIKNNISRKCKTKQCDLFVGIGRGEKFDIIVSNPPYIKKSDIINLDELVKKEPKIALDGGRDGLYFYKKIARGAIKHLSDGGYLMFEIGYDELEAVKKIISKYKQYTIVECIKDYSNNDRVVVCRFHQK